MAIRAFWQHHNRHGQVDRIEVHDAEFSGTEFELCGDSTGFSFRHDEITSESNEKLINIHANRVQIGKLDFRPRIESTLGETLLTDIRDSDNKRFHIEWYKDGNFEWAGWITTRIFSYPEKATGFFAHIRATDFEILKGIDYPLSDTRQTFIDTFSELFSELPVATPIRTATSWVEENVTAAVGSTTYDFLAEIYHETKALREFARTGDETDQPITKWEALEHVAEPALLIRQMNGHIYIDQITELADPTDVHETIYNADGSLYATDGLVSLWPFDGDVTDAVGNNDGTINGDPQFVSGVSGQALGFDGDDAFSAEIEGTTFSDELTFTTSIWFMVTGTPDSGNVMGIIGRDSGGRWAIDHWFDGEELRFGVRGSGIHNITVHFDSDDYNEWYHAVLVHESTGSGTGVLKAYLNGDLISQDSYSDTWTADNEVGIASGNASIGGSPKNLIGKTDEPRIYNRALSEAEIKFLYEHPSGRTTAIDRRQTGYTSVDNGTPAVKITSNNGTYPAIKRARATFDHRSLVTNIQLPGVIVLEGNSDSESFSQLFISNGEQKLVLQGDVVVSSDPLEGGQTSIPIEIESGGHWWDGDNWVESQTNTEIDIGEHGGGTGFIFSYAIETDNVPADADGTLTITFHSPNVSYTINDVRHYASFNVLGAIIGEEDTTAIDFQLTQTGGETEVLDLGDTWYGDGPGGNSPSALRWGTGDGERTADTWQRRGTTTGYRNFHENLLKEVLDMGRTNMRKLQADIWGSYDPSKVLDYNGSYFFYSGGKYDGVTGKWQVTLMELDLVEDGSDNFENILKFTDETGSGSGSTGGSTGGGGGLSESQANALYFEESKNLSEGDPATIRQNIGTVIGSDVQAWSATLDDLSANLTATANELNRLDGDLATVQANLGLTDGSADLAFNTLDLQAGANNESIFRLSHPTAPTSAGFEIGFKNITSDNSGIGFAVEFSDTLTDFMDVERETGNVRLLDNTLTINGQQLFTKGSEQLLSTDAAPTFATLNTGQGDNELYPMNQAVRTTDSVTFGDASLSNITENRVLLAGPSGLITDDANVTYDGTAFEVSFADGDAQLRNAGGGTHFRLFDGSDQTFIVRNYTNSGYQADFNLGGIDVSGRGLFTIPSGSPSTANSILQLRDSTYALQGGVDDTNSEVWLRNAEPGVTAGATLYLGASSGRFTHDTFFETLAGSTSYVSGILGSGTRWETSGSTFFEIDNMRVRNELRAHIFKKDIVRASNGYLLISDSAQIAETKFLSDDTSGQTLDIDAGDGNATFSVGDLLWAKNIRNDGSLVINGLKAEVTAVDTSDPDVTVLTIDTSNGGNGAQVYDGDTIVRVSGGYLMNDASSEFSPFLDVYDGINTWGDFQSSDKLKGRYGNLNGLTIDSVSLSGYGLYSDNVYLTGSILVGDLSETSNYMSFDGSTMDINAESFNLESGDLLITDLSGQGIVRAGPAGTSDQVGITANESGSGGSDSIAFWAGENFTSRTSAPAWIKRNGHASFASGILTATATEVGLAAFTANSDLLSTTSNGISIEMGDGLYGSVATGFAVSDGTLNNRIFMAEAAGGEFVFGVTESGTDLVRLGSLENFISSFSITEDWLTDENVYIGNDVFQNRTGSLIMGNFFDGSDPGIEINSDNNNWIQLRTRDPMSSDSIFRVQIGGNDIVDINPQSAQFFGFEATATQLQSTNLSGGGDGSFTTDGILINSGGYISAPNFYIDSAGAGALGDLSISGQLTMQGSQGSIRLPQASDGTRGWIDQNGITLPSASDQALNFTYPAASGINDASIYTHQGDMFIYGHGHFNNVRSITIEPNPTSFGYGLTNIGGMLTLYDKDDSFSTISGSNVTLNGISRSRVYLTGSGGPTVTEMNTAQSLRDGMILFVTVARSGSNIFFDYTTGGNIQTRNDDPLEVLPGGTVFFIYDSDIGRWSMMQDRN